MVIYMDLGNAIMVRTIISISSEEKQWLDAYSRRHGLSSAEIVRRAIDHYRRQVGKEKNLRRILQETAGAWSSFRGDSQAYVDKRRAEWKSRK
ncbi:MAG: hypothetical protein NTU60_11215 [Candidatus Aminicenantes bacterium]|nr:hypothetical protein [Candidatus Aminicenantes bacterium]